jgi:ABC-type sugar transport system ATPase subunit
MTRSATDAVPAVRLRGITKDFPGVRALESIDLEVRAGSCHALVGENGAGKSTLGKILAGLHQPDKGTLEVHGNAVVFADPRDAEAAGIGMVHQELLFCENLSVAENLTLGHAPRRWGVFVDRAAMARRARELLGAIGAEIDPWQTVGALHVSQLQLVQIAAAVGRGARILIFDEPTSSLSQTESERLFALIQNLQRQGVTIIYVSHRLEEVFLLCDTVSVLRDGQHVATRPTRDHDRASLVREMIGRPLENYTPSLQTDVGEELLRVEGLSSPGAFHDLSFTLHRGEILGVAGLVGAGRTELAEALFGLDPEATGRVLMRGQALPLGSPQRALHAGLGLVPEDRKRHGLVLSMNACENISLPILERFSRGGFVRQDRERGLARSFFERLSIRAPHTETPVAVLSGGNQQKVVLARWLAARCEVLLVDEPTRGVDVGAKAEMHDLIGATARNGAGVLLISSELPELISLATRIIVLREGRFAGEVPRAQANQETLMRLMAGVR